MERKSIDLTEYRELLKFKSDNLIWDFGRRRWLQITPEEIVRQSLILYLHHNYHIPLSFIKTEHSIYYNKRLKRIDIVVFNKDGDQVVLCECKAPYITLSFSVIEQLLNYHKEMPCQYLIISNGWQTHIYNKKSSSLESIDHLPKFAQLC